MHPSSRADASQTSPQRGPLPPAVLNVKRFVSFETPALDAAQSAWCNHVCQVFEALEEAQSQDEIARFSHALETTAHGYARRPRHPVTHRQALLDNHVLATLFAEHADLDGCATALACLASEFAAMDARWADFDHIETMLLHDLAWAYGRCRSPSADADRAMAKLADAVGRRLQGDADCYTEAQRQDLRSWLGQHGAGMAEAHGQMHPGARRVRTAMKDSDRLSQRAKTLSRNARSEVSRKGIEAVLKTLQEQALRDPCLPGYSWRALTNMANALSKFTRKSKGSESDRRQDLQRHYAMVDAGLATLASAVRNTRNALDKASAIDLSLLVNAFRKLAGDKGDDTCNAALRTLAAEIGRRDSAPDREEQWKEFGAIELSNPSTASPSWPGMLATKLATARCICWLLKSLSVTWAESMTLPYPISSMAFPSMSLIRHAAMPSPSLAHILAQATMPCCERRSWH